MPVVDVSCVVGCGDVEGCGMLWVLGFLTDIMARAIETTIANKISMNSKGFWEIRLNESSRGGWVVGSETSSVGATDGVVDAVVKGGLVAVG